MLREKIDAIRQRVSLQEFVKTKGVPLKKSGDYSIGKCPFHADSSASFAVYDDHFHCYGCNKHGDVIDFLVYKGLEFGEALKEAAGVAGLKLEYKPSAMPRGDEELSAWVMECHKALLANEEAIKYLSSRGLKLDAIKRFKIGIAKKSPAKYGKDVDGRIVFPIMRSGRPINATCRKYSPNNGLPKYKTLGGFEVFPFGMYNLKTKSGKCVLVEGVIDAEIIIALGMPACATLMLHFKQEWLSLLSRDVEYILCYDNDENESGQKGTRSVGEILYEAGFRVSVAALPDSKDPGDLISNADDIAALKHTLANPYPWPEFLIRTMPTEGGVYDTEKLLEGEIFPALHKAPAVSLDALLDLLAKRGGYKRASLKAAYEAWRRKVSAVEGKSENGGNAAEFEPVFGDEDPVYFNPSQWFGEDRACYTVYAEAPDGDLFPFIVTSDRAVFPLGDKSIANLGMKMRSNKYPTERITWPGGKRYKFSLYRYLKSEENCNPVQLFNEITELIEKYIWFPSEWKDTYLFMVLWIIGTYVHQLFRSYPYLHAMTLPQSGKSELLGLVGEIAFNAAKSDSITESSVSRSVNSDSATLLVDEAENYRQKGSDSQSAIFEVLKGGYKKGGASYKSGDKKSNFKPERYDTYSCKMFASTQPIDSILATRCIEVHIQKSPKEIPSFMPDEKVMSHKLAELRGCCYIFGLQYFQQIRQIYLELEPIDGMRNRNWEIWKPIVAMARFLDASFEAEGRKIDAETRIVGLSRTIIQRKKDREGDMNLHQRIMQVIIDFIKDNYNPVEIYPTWILVEKIQKELNMPRFSPESLSRFVFDEALIAISRQDDRIKTVSSHASMDTGRRIWHLRLRRELVYQRAVELFNMPADLLEELKSEPTDPFADNIGAVTS